MLEAYIEFSKTLAERWTLYLQEQAHSPFFMAKAKKTGLGYKHAGDIVSTAARAGAT